MILRRPLQQLFVFGTRLLCGVRIYTREIALSAPRQRIYFANHSSNFDFLAVWSSLPEPQRLQTRPAAARDYWSGSGVRGFISREIFRAVYVERKRAPDSQEDPLSQVKEALRHGDSVIIFPEGTRSLDGEVMPFKKGLYHLAVEFPLVDLVPVYLENLNRILPKGEILLLPLLSRVIFGPPLQVHPAEEKQAFLNRAHSALLELKP
jgi:1-acyl-sn-glycerol-3-phosphate acyltransferase